MTKCTIEHYEFPGLKRCRIISQFGGGAIGGAEGGILRRQIDRRFDMTRSSPVSTRSTQRFLPSKKLYESMTSLLRQPI